MLQLENVTIEYDGEPAVKNVSFSVSSGEMVCLVGESGSGKSSLIKGVVSVLDENGAVSDGSIRFEGRELVGMDEKQLRTLRGAQIAMVPQQAELSLDPVTKIGKQFYEAMRAHQKISIGEARACAKKHLRELSLNDPERILNAYPFMLSGGTNQRVALAIAMTQRAKLVLADEPTSQQDVTVQVQIVETMLKLRETYNTAFLVVTHNMGVVARLANKVGVLYKGRLVEWGSRDDIIYSPAHPYTQALISTIPKLHGCSENARPPEKSERADENCPYRCFCTRGDCQGAVPLHEIAVGHLVSCPTRKKADRE